MSDKTKDSTTHVLINRFAVHRCNRHPDFARLIKDMEVPLPVQPPWSRQQDKALRNG